MWNCKTICVEFGVNINPERENVHHATPLFPPASFSPFSSPRSVADETFNVLWVSSAVNNYWYRKWCEIRDSWGMDTTSRWILFQDRALTCVWGVRSGELHDWFSHWTVTSCSQPIKCIWFRYSFICSYVEFSWYSLFVLFCWFVSFPFYSFHPFYNESSCYTFFIWRVKHVTPDTSVISLRRWSVVFSTEAGGL